MKVSSNKSILCFLICFWHNQTSWRNDFHFVEKLFKLLERKNWATQYLVAKSFFQSDSDKFANTWETNRQTERQTVWLTDRGWGKDRQISITKAEIENRQVYTGKEIEGQRETDRETESERYRQTDRHNESDFYTWKFFKVFSFFLIRR